MKNLIKHYFPLILTVLCAFFAIGIFFHRFTNSPYDIFTSIGSSFSDVKQKDNLSTVVQKEEAQPKAPLPSILYTGGTLTVGNVFPFQELFTLLFSDGTTTSPSAITTAALYLNDIQTLDGVSVLTQFSSHEIETFEELPSAVVYDKEKKVLYFYQTGTYKLSLHFFPDGEDGIFFECMIPVEVN